MAVLVILVVLGVIAVAVLAIMLSGDKSEGQASVQDQLGGRTPLELPRRGEFGHDIVGESHYQNALDEICGGKTEVGHHKEMLAYLVTEDDNPHDSKAVRVQIEGRIVGYLSRADAREMRRQLNLPDGFILRVPALIVGGWDDGEGSVGHYGVKLDLPEAE